MSSTTVELVTLTKIECGSCGGVYAITESHRAHCQKHGKDWHCPYCQTSWGFSYVGSRQERDLRDAKARAEAAERRAASLEGRATRLGYQRRAAVGQVTKIKRRVGNGVCPCCQRTFRDLAAHMATKHPEYMPGATEGADEP